MGDFSLQPIKRKIVLEGFNSIYYFEFGKDFSHTPEKHDFWEMVYVDSGDINAVTDGLGQTLTQGQVIFHRPGEIHAHVSNNLVPNNMLVVSFTSKSEAMGFFDKKIFTLDKTGKTLLTLFMNEAKNALGEIPGEYDNKNALDFSAASRDSIQLLECYFTEFLLVLSRTAGEAQTKVIRSDDARDLGQSSIVELIINHFGENIYNNITLPEVCGKFFMGKSSLCKLFVDHTGEAPMEYFSKLKMKEAKKLLRNSEYSVSRISDMFGYSSIHNFSRAFKKRFGISPVEYRRKINK